MKEEVFYVLFSTKFRGYLIDDQLGYTDNVLDAERYDSFDEAQKEIKYYKYRSQIKVVKVTVTPKFVTK